MLSYLLNYIQYPPVCYLRVATPVRVVHYGIERLVYPLPEQHSRSAPEEPDSVDWPVLKSVNKACLFYSWLACIHVHVAVSFEAVNSGEQSRGVYSTGIWVGGFGQLNETLTLFKTQKM